MLGLLINKELKNIIASPKFTGTFLVCSVLILLSVYTGIKEYKGMVERYDAASRLVDQELQQETSWSNMETTVYRKPDPMQIFAAGLDYDIGRFSSVSSKSGVKLIGSAYSDDPIYAVFRFLDFSCITVFILTLFAILFTYNAVNGEKEDGTLKLILSNSVSRATYLSGKAIGAWLGLVVPISIPIMLGVLLLFVFNIPVTLGFWLRLSGLFVLSLALFSFFIFLGILLSALTRRPAISFLISLVCWIFLVMILPRAGVLAAGTIVPVPRIAEIESRLSSYSQNKWDEFSKSASERWQEVNGRNDQEISEDEMWTVMQMEDSLRKAVTDDINRYDEKLREDLRQRRLQQQTLAFSFARISPVSAYQLGAMRLAGTDVKMKGRYEDAIGNYRTQFTDFVEQKKEESGDRGRIMLAFTFDEDGNQSMQMTSDRKKGNLDLSGMPEFVYSSGSLGQTASSVAIEFGIILLFTVVAFAGAFVSFLRYDVR